MRQAEFNSLMDFAGATLQDWGEFRLINGLVLPLLNADGPRLGDDCALISVNDSTVLAVTSDPAPRPLVWALGEEDYRSWGWYAVAINVSDLAVTGAAPICFTSSMEAPREMLIHDFAEFLKGVKEACQVFSIVHAGGNIRIAPRFECHGTAVGEIRHHHRIGRAGCQPGDRLVVVGPIGNFAAAFLRARRFGLDTLRDMDARALRRPMPQLREMRTLIEAGLVRAASDNSDGLLGAFWNIAERSGCGIYFELDKALLDPDVVQAASQENICVWNAAVFWGDWSVALAVASNSLEEFTRVATEANIRYQIMGKAIEGPPRLLAKVDGRTREMVLLRNESFTTASFDSSVEQHVEYMLRTPLFS